ncbi:Phenylpyruvate tautomerase PptA, 4-oxalocrotonate tautomerase family [Agreia bicolorata]|uniref:Phenylpyruvate tautomerase PptA, 4-oxalocrotonate tautomerase family n=1 Tax=Agreia bicolorata TaxID=110935 RepID=A0A1T4XMI5_9MICO|nr:tautomerase family protein [Agreia bicolorata]SKA90734.1 Phenylpyruvate tautomerase PptA, 4-oxalocrotonate tautomerase family [Agreia bicolorata]
MAQVTIYARRHCIETRRAAISDAVHGAVMAALAYPAEKRFHRFIAFDGEDFIYPEDRGENYTIIEISMFDGRSESAKRDLIEELFARLEAEAGIAPHSVEITITETPRVNWGIRGVNGADLALGYKVDV